jgi:ribosomal protein S18 acetylase RimI-like enzyme
MTASASPPSRGGVDSATVALERQKQQLAPPTTTTTTTPAPLRARVRPFRRSDLEAICDACKDVYGGTDYMPRVIGHLGELAARIEEEEEEERTIVLVAEEEEAEETRQGGGDGDGDQQRPPTTSSTVGVVVAQLRGEGHAFLFGLRVHPRAQGRGVGRLLMSSACDAARSAGARHLVGATIPSNAASIALFQQTGHREVARVGVWPPFPLLAEYERHVGFVPPPGRRPREEDEGEGAATTSYAAGARPHVRLLDHLAGGEVRRLLQQHVADDDELPPPKKCECVEELTRALAAVRRRQQQQQRSDGALASEHHLQWIPAMYEAMPARGAWARQRVRESGAWLLFEPSSATVAAVVVAAPSLEARRFVAGVVAVDGAAAARALLLAEQLTPQGRGHFLAFMDVPFAAATQEEEMRRRGQDEAAPPAPPPTTPCALAQLFDLTRVEETHPEGRGCMLVFHREVVGGAMV